MRNSTIQPIYDIFNDGTDISDNYYDKPTIDTKLLEKANVITLNNFMTNTNNTLALKAPISNPTFTGNVGINRATTSALEIAGEKELTTFNGGIKLGYSQMFPVNANGYGITITSDQGGAIDFTGYGSNNYYLGRLLYNMANNSMYFYARNTFPSTPIFDQVYQMKLNYLGELDIQTKLSVPSISLNGNNLQATLDTKANLDNPTFTSDITLSTNGANKITFNSSTPNYNSIGYDSANNLNMRCNNQTIITSSGTTTNINTDIISTTTNSTKRLTLETTHASGTPYFTLKCRNSAQSSIYQTNSNLYWAAESANLAMNFSVNNGTSTLTPLKILSNGVINAGNLGSFNNKVLVLFDSGASDDPLTATNFYGFGVNSQTLRYQTAVASHSHKFYCGSTLSFTISNGTGASGSDIRWKSEIENINGTEALEKVNLIQAKSFKYMDCNGRQHGFIAQDIYPIVPELVSIDNESDDKFMFLQYDRFSAIHNEAIKELYKIIQGLESRIAILENK